MKIRSTELAALQCFLISILMFLTWPPADARAESAATDPVPTTYYQNLVELFNRKSMSVTKPSDLLIDNQVWQSERVIFRDATYGTEVWKLSNDPDYSRHNNGINKTPWNSDGSIIAFESTRRSPGESYDGQPKWYVMDGAGNSFRRLFPYGVGNATDIPRYTKIAAWDRLNPSYMYFGYFDGLYKLELAPGTTGDLMTLEEPVPETVRRKEIDSYLSENNRVMLIDRNTYVRDGSFYPNVYMIDLKKAHGAPGRLIQYNLHFNLTGVTGHSVANECCFHEDGTTFMRTPNDSWQVTYEGTSGGETLMFEIPYNGNPDSIRIAMTDYDPVTPYYSHPFWGPDGVRVIFYGQPQRGNENWGVQLRNQRTQTPIATLTPTGKALGGHNAWDGYDPDWIISSPSSGDWTWTIVKAKTDGTFSAPIVNTYTKTNGINTSDYSSYPRPAQSPDNTKAFYASSMLKTSDDKVDMYVAVSRHPSPPVNVRISSASSSQVSLVWDRPPLSREIMGFHVYRSDDVDNRYVEVSPGLVTANQYVDGTISSGHTYYYAVTSEEHSELESDYLSNVLRVIVSGSTATWSNYIAEGLKGWDATAPSQVTGLAVSQLSAGVFQLTWQAPVDKDVRYFNIYYSIAGAPSATQDRLIASPDPARGKFIDWQANPANAPFYGVTAVDRAGNESLPVYFPSGTSDTIPPRPIRDLR